MSLKLVFSACMNVLWKLWNFVVVVLSSSPLYTPQHLRTITMTITSALATCDPLLVPLSQRKMHFPERSREKQDDARHACYPHHPSPC